MQERLKRLRRIRKRHRTLLMIHDHFAEWRFELSDLSPNGAELNMRYKATKAELDALPRYH